MIDPEGYVYKCWNDIGEKHYSIGMIQSLHDDIASEWEQYDQMNYDSCRECELLPVCAGGCTRGVVHFGKSPECEPCRYILGELLAF